MKKNQVVILIILIVLILGGTLYWLGTIPPSEKIASQEQISQPTTAEKKIYTFSATISKIDEGNNFLMVKLTQEKEVKVILSQETRLFKLALPSKEITESQTTFSPQQQAAALSDLTMGDRILIGSSQDYIDQSQIEAKFIYLWPK